MAAKFPIVLFLDFDGVLHPKGAGGPRFTRPPLFEAFLREPAMVDMSIVISSTWRQAYALPKLRGFFAPDIATRIIGCTPTLSSYSSDFERGEEIEAWLAASHVARWVGLDDDVDGFTPRLRRRLVLCDGTRGICIEDLEKVRSILSSQA